MNTFLFTIVNQGLEKLLKTEVETYFPKWKFAYSRPGFLTFKGGEGEPISHLWMSFRTGEVVRKLTLDELKDFKAGDNLFWRRDENLTPPWPMDFELQKVQRNKTYFIVMMTDPDQFWLGKFKSLNDEAGDLYGAKIELPESAPSRAYLKIAEASLIHGLNFKNKTVVEFGSAPGGAVHYLLNDGAKVIGVDPGEMDKDILNHPNYTHINRPIEKCTRDQFPEKVDWVLSDINLPPSVVIREIRQVFEKHPPEEGFILTLKMTKNDFVGRLDNFQLQLKKLGFKKTTIRYLPSHKQEIMLMAQRG